MVWPPQSRNVTYMQQLAVSHCERENFSTLPNDSWRLKTTMWRTLMVSSYQHERCLEEYEGKCRCVQTVEESS